jgi:hypothetical protein
MLSVTLLHYTILGKVDRSKTLMALIQQYILTWISHAT